MARKGFTEEQIGVCCGRPTPVHRWGRSAASSGSRSRRATTDPEQGTLSYRLVRRSDVTTELGAPYTFPPAWLLALPAVERRLRKCRACGRSPATPCGRPPAFPGHASSLLQGASLPENARSRWTHIRSQDQVLLSRSEMVRSRSSSS
jgi:hypothetical protein